MGKRENKLLVRPWVKVHGKTSMGSGVRAIGQRVEALDV